MNRKFQTGNITVTRESQISPWDSEDMVEGSSALRKGKLIQQQIMEKPKPVHVMLPEKRLRHLDVAVSERPRASTFVVRKHHKTVQRSILRRILATESVFVETPRFEITFSAFRAVSPVPIVRNEPIPSAPEKRVDTVIEQYFPEEVTKSCVLPAQPAINTSSTPASTPKKKAPKKLTSIRDLLADVNQHYSQSERNSLSSRKMVVYDIDMEVGGYQGYTRRSWKNRQQTDYSLFDRAI